MKNEPKYCDRLEIIDKSAILASKFTRLLSLAVLGVVADAVDELLRLELPLAYAVHCDEQGIFGLHATTLQRLVQLLSG